MIKSLSRTIALSLMLFSCISEEMVRLAPLTQDKKVTFELFTDQDYTSLQYESYFVNLNMGIVLVDKVTKQEFIIFEQATGWIAFKDIPQAPHRIMFERDINIDPDRFLVTYGYSYHVRIGHTIQMKAINDFLRPWEDEKVVVIKF